MSFFEENLKLLAKKNPSLAQRIRNHTELSSAFELAESASGDPNLVKNGVFLHDKIDPEQEAINLLKEIKVKHSGAFHYIYGLGLGYVLKRYNKALKGYILLFEPDLDILRLTLEMVDFTPELANKNLFIFDDLKDIESFYPEHFFHGIQVTTTIQQVYKTYNLQSAQEFVNHLGYIHGIYDSNFKLYWNKQHPWANAMFENLTNFPKYDEVKVLKDKFKNKPAIIISAGPSLNKNIDLISKYQDNFVIFCVGTALKSALKHGIIPDFICFVEYYPVTAKMLDENQAINSNLILQPITHRDLYQREAKNKFVFYADNDEVSKWAAKKFNIDVKDYINRGTVSVNALASAKILGCNPIILTGQDLAYTNEKCYADGSIYEDFQVKEGKVTTDNLDAIVQKTDVSKERIERRFGTMTKQLYKVKGQNGEILTAPGDYASFIKYFTEIASIYEKSVKLINSTEGGAQIDGYENIPLKEVIERYAQNKLDKNFQHTTQFASKQMNIIKNEVTSAMELFDKSYKAVLDKGNQMVEEIHYENLSVDNVSQYDAQMVKLLELYKKLRSLPYNSLLDLLMARNIFFLGHYLKTDLADSYYKLCLLRHFSYLFKNDYQKFILPAVEKLKKIDFTKE